MKWLKQKLFKWTTEGRDLQEKGYAQLSIKDSVPVRSSKIGNSANRMNFSVYKASGGHIVEFSTYDENTDRHYESLHIISSEEDFGDALGKLVFMECLKK